MKSESALSAPPASYSLRNTRSQARSNTKSDVRQSEQQSMFPQEYLFLDGASDRLYCPGSVTVLMRVVMGELFSCDLVNPAASIYFINFV